MGYMENTGYKVEYSVVLVNLLLSASSNLWISFKYLMALTWQTFVNQVISCSSKAIEPVVYMVVALHIAVYAPVLFCVEV